MGACNAVRLALIEEESPFGGLFLKKLLDWKLVLIFRHSQVAELIDANSCVRGVQEWNLATPVR